jgi:dihydrofolate reductase
VHRRIEGYAIVSADDMIANAAGIHPPELKHEADLRFFHGALDRAGVVVHGRNSHEGGPHAARRARMILTRSVAGLAPDRENPKALLWNPGGASFAEAWRAAGEPAVVAVIGGTEVFGLFLAIGYDVFYLTRAARVRLPGGRPVFPGIPPGAAEEVLAAHGLRPDAPSVLDAEAAVTLVAWRRTGPSDDAQV